MNMDAVALSNSFATIVGLLCNYLSESRAVSGDKHEDFIQWIEEKRHTELKQFIFENQQLSVGIKNLFLQENKNILRKLNSLDRALTSVASHFEGFKEIASALKLNDTPSPQALTILRQFYESNGTIIVEQKFRGMTYFQIMGGNGGVIEIQEERFLEDDLDALCNLGFLLPNANKQGERVYRLTRQVIDFLTALEPDGRTLFARGEVRKLEKS